MTKKPVHRRFYYPYHNPDIYMSRIEHIEALMNLHREYAEEAKRLIEEMMKGYPERFVDRNAWEAGHKDVLQRILSLEKVINSFMDTKEQFNRRIAWAIGLTATTVGALTTAIHMFWGK